MVETTRFNARTINTQPQIRIENLFQNPVGIEPEGGKGGDARYWRKATSEEEQYTGTRRTLVAVTPKCVLYGSWDP
jgi:hypothetical protein